MAALALLGGGFALGRATSDRPEAPPAPPVTRPTPSPAPTPPVRVAPLGRTELLAAIDAAADAFAAGRPDEGAAELAGRRFELRLPFGCRGPAAEDSAEALRWNYDQEAKALRFSVAPAVWPVGEWAFAPEDAGNPVEAVEGFWIPRPWLSSEDCPPRPPAPSPRPSPSPTAAPSPQPTPTPATPPPALALPPERTVGIAQFFSATSARVLRRDGQAFEAVESVAPDALDASRGFRLVLRGRVGRAPDGRPITCRASNPDQRPTCLVAAEIDAIAIENSATGENVAEWRS